MEASKRYPRGMARFSMDEPRVVESIELRDYGFLFKELGEEESTFAPYTNLLYIKYELIPQELLDEQEKATGSKD